MLFSTSYPTRSLFTLLQNSSNQPLPQLFLAPPPRPPLYSLRSRYVSLSLYLCTFHLIFSSLISLLSTHLWSFPVFNLLSHFLLFSAFPTWSFLIPSPIFSFFSYLLVDLYQLLLCTSPCSSLHSVLLYKRVIVPLSPPPLLRLPAPPPPPLTPQLCLLLLSIPPRLSSPLSSLSGI